MSYLLDTNVVSELRKLPRGNADPGVTTWITRVDAAETYLSVISVLELELGVLRLERKDSRQGAMLRNWLERQVLPSFEGRTLPLDLDAARRCAKLHVPDPRSERDAMVAASALAHGMTIVTRNEADFTGCGVALINPWQQA
ncbi:MAG: type II toxin-antitoxin system VapC family toxin [Xanthomonadales bacterium]|nr:type II toxin-antitoxin system VapC family toxin [Xanthomonadales bacterium]